MAQVTQEPRILTPPWASRNMSKFHLKPGDRVKIVGKHLRKGEIGVFEKLEYINVLRTIKPKVKLDNGGSCFADSIELERV